MPTPLEHSRFLNLRCPDMRPAPGRGTLVLLCVAAGMALAVALAAF